MACETERSEIANRRDFYLTSSETLSHRQERALRFNSRQRQADSLVEVNFNHIPAICVYGHLIGERSFLVLSLYNREGQKFEELST